MTSQRRKTGRPTAFYKMADGTKIDGLSRLSDGRWKVSPGPGIAKPIKFREADERLAVKHYHDLRAKAGRPSESLVAVGTYRTAADAVIAGLEHQLNAQGLGRSARIKLTNPEGRGGAVTVNEARTFDDPVYWQWLRTQLIERAAWVSQKVGLDLVNVKAPPPSVKLSALLDAYVAKPKLSANEITRSRTFWAEFVKAVGVTHVGEVGHPQIEAYESIVRGMDLSTKSDHHRYTKIKTIIAYGLKRGMDTAGCRKALDAAAMLDAQHRDQNDPRPIEPAAFWKVYRAARDAGDDSYAALMLTALNAAMYGGEVAAMRWSEIDLKAGTYVGRRPKTGVSRVAVLWPETIAALKDVPPRDGIDAIFNTSVRSHTILSVLRAWRRYRKAARYGEEVTFGQIRDAAYSIACQSGTLDQAKALAGHRFSGMADAYVRRRPDFVAQACDSIRREFEVQKHARPSRVTPTHVRAAFNGHDIL